MRKYRIFLASSVELDRDKELFEIFVSKKNKEWHKDGIFLELLTWKDFVDAMSQSRLQNDYIRVIKESDFFVVLFHTKIGRYTEEEFDSAYQQFKLHGHPLIFTYFRSLEEEAIEDESIIYIKDKIDKLGHFYSLYKNNDDLNYKFDQQLDRLRAEGRIISDPLDWTKYRNYFHYFFFLPLLFIYFIYRYLFVIQPFNLTVTAKEVRGVPDLPYEKGTITLHYADKTEKLEITDEAIFKKIDGHFRNKKANLVFESDGFEKIDSMIELDDNINLFVRRNSNLGKISGQVTDDDQRPVADAVVTVLDLRCKTDINGYFTIDIPSEKQQRIQYVSAAKPGYISELVSGTPNQASAWPLKLHRR
jgi:hypothetical protein